jgi:hypothetical protein
MNRNPLQHFAPQGTKEWMLARAGCITASRFNDLLTPAKLEPSKAMRPYLCQLAGEAVLGGPMESYQSAAMDRGKEFEGEARDYYELTQGGQVEEAGLIYMDGDDRRVACSPDGLIGDDGGLELKCPGIPKHIEYLLGDCCPPEYVHQVQGCLFVTGRQWWDFMSYFPGLPPLIVRCEPDPRWFTALDAVLPVALDELAKMIAKVKEKAA